MDIFISYEYGDLKYRKQLVSIIKNPNANLPYNPIYETEDKRDSGQKAINNYVLNLMEGNGAVLCLIGRNTYNAPGVIKEINTANNKKIPVIPIRIQNTNGSLPSNIKNRTEINLKPKEIRKALDKKENWLKIVK